MPNRILREGILTSPRMKKLGWPEEVFYRRLMSVVDDFGRYYADPGLLRAACYPRQLDKVSDPDIGKWLRACVDAALVRVYPAEDGERYLELLRFGQQVRAKKSKFPDQRSGCDTNDEHMRSRCVADAHLDVSVSGDVFEDEDGGVSVVEPARKRARDDGPPKRKASRRCPESFEVTEEMRAWASSETPGVDLDFETKAMLDHEYDKPRSDWAAAWRNWMRIAYRRQPAGRVVAMRRRESTEEHNRRAFDEWMGESADDGRTIDA